MTFIKIESGHFSPAIGLRVLTFSSVT
jgi:hypothetical protein